MALLKYLRRKEGPVRECEGLSKKETEKVNERVRQVLAPGENSLKAAGTKRCATRGSYTDYTPEDRAKIGKYATENRPAKATKHFSVPETTARRLKAEYLRRLKTMRSESSDNAVPIVKSLPTKTQGEDLCSLASKN